MKTGAIYIITQDSRYRGLLLNSAASLKRVMPDLPITVFSQFPLESSDFERVIRVEASQDGFYDKTLFFQQTPYERTLFIDADTYIVEPVPELFTMLDQFDFAATHEEYLNTDWWNRYPRPDIPPSFPEFNTGILAYKRSPQMDSVLKDWSELYRSFLEDHPGQEINDQPFFRAAVYSNQARIATLTREYNCKFRGQGYLNGRVKILHGHVDLQLEEAFVRKALGVLTKTGWPYLGSPEAWLGRTFSAAPGASHRGRRETPSANAERTRGAKNASEVNRAWTERWVRRLAKARLNHHLPLRYALFGGSRSPINTRPSGDERNAARLRFQECRSGGGSLSNARAIVLRRASIRRAS
jgi:hypothetical protein